MRVVLQRVRQASVSVQGIEVASIGQGLVVFVAVGHGDTNHDVDYIADKIAGMRIFPGESPRFTLSALDIKAALLVVSQFTLYGDTRKGLRPDFTQAAPSSIAEPLYAALISRLRQTSLHIETGVFGANMDVGMINDGPVTIWVESPK